MEKNISNSKDLSDFILALKKDFLKNKKNWQNWTIEDYLDAIAAWIASHRDVEVMSKEQLQAVADVLEAGKYYE